MENSNTSATSPWPARLAWLLACATFPLIFVGGLVTTTDAGMAVPDWPSTYGYNLFLYPWQTWVFGPWDLFIEHGHRLLGAAVGLLTIALLVSLWRFDSRAWLRNLGIVALLLVIAQGMLGGMRVLLDERLLAMIHGCTGPLFFAVTAALVVFTSRKWIDAPNSEESRNQLQAATGIQSGNIRSFALLAVFLLFAQLILGAMLRHVPLSAPPSFFATVVKFHLFLAGALVLIVSLMRWLTRNCREDLLLLRRLSTLLLLLVIVQVMLGIGTWAMKYSVAQWIAESSWLASYTIQSGSWLQTNMVTGHVAIGSLLLATSVAMALYSLRLLPQPQREKLPTRIAELAL